MCKLAENLETLSVEVEAWKARGQRVVLANGCFDVVHGGHVSYLEESKAAGDVLVVGLNSDVSVRGLKGEGRPVCNEAERVALLEALECVDRIVVFSEATCENLLRTLVPSVHAKGTDYTAETVPERVISDSLGIETLITGDPKENATKAIIKKARGAEA
jgi:D-glycero-beta-D-manno-heptose 1-phosphate adenylyltransferase